MCQGQVIDFCQCCVDLCQVECCWIDIQFVYFGVWVGYGDVDCVGVGVVVDICCMVDVCWIG